MSNCLFILLVLLQFLEFTVSRFYEGEYRKNKDFGFQEQRCVKGTQEGRGEG